MATVAETLDVGGKEGGNLWNRTIVSDKSDGCFLTIGHTRPSVAGGSKTHIRFLHVAADLSGDRIFAGDHHGNYFLFDIDKNHFTLLFSIGVSCTAVAWNNFRYNEVLVALSNYEIRLVVDHFCSLEMGIVVRAVYSALRVSNSNQFSSERL